MKLSPSIVVLLSSCAFSLGAFAGFGDIDPTFSPFPGGCSAIEPIENGGAYVDANSASQRVVARLDARGIPNASWGTNGLVAYGGPGFPAISQLVRGNDGDLFIVDTGGVLHVDAAGHIDSGFGNGGRTATGATRSAALQPDGKLVVLTEEAGMYVFVRLTAQGAFDSSFGRFGELPVPGVSPSQGLVYGWAVRGDGGAELGVYRVSDSDGAPPVPTLFVVSADSPDSSLSPGRVVPQGIASWMSPAAKAEPTGGLAIAGPSASLAHFNADGSIDSAFGSQGHVLLRTTVADASFLWREPTGQWTVLGISIAFHGQRGPGTLSAQRFSAAGVPDAAFGEKAIDDGGRVAARARDGSILHANTSCSLTRHSTDAAQTETSVVEYFHSGLDHYFMTSSANEIADLDSGAQPGWIRTGESFGAWSPSQLPGAAHVCRFYGDPVIGPNSHFYTGEDFECNFLVELDARTPKGVGAWHLEGRPFDIAIPVNGACPANLQPVYRVFNQIVGTVNGPNHRYMTDTTLYAAMQAKGWGAEGVHFCAPPRFN